MFKELAPLLAKRSLILTINPVEADRVRVTVTPRPTGKDEAKELSQPFAVEGTIEELDNEFPGALVNYTAQHMTLERSLAQIKADMDAALKEAKDEAAKKVADAKKTSKSTSSVKKDEKKTEPAKVETPKPEPPSLFDAPAETPVAAATPSTDSAEEDEAADESESDDQPEEQVAAAPAASATPITQPAAADTRNEEDEILQEAFFGAEDDRIAA